MDPKMDSGVAMRLSPTLLASEAERAGRLAQDKSFSTDQIVLLMDQLLAAEVAFYQGHNPLQTFLTCLLLHDLRRISNPFLRTYAYSLIRACDLMREMVTQTDICDDEDFNSFMIGYHLLPEVPLDSLYRMIDLARAELLGRGKESGSGPLQYNLKEIGLFRAISARLRFKELFCKIQTNFESPLNFFQIPQQLQQARKLLSVIQSSHSTLVKDGTTLPEGIFDATISRRVYFTAPPNVVPLPTVPEAIQFLDQFLANCESFLAWPSIQDVSITELMGKIEAFSSQRPDVLSRARLFVSSPSASLYLLLHH